MKRIAIIYLPLCVRASHEQHLIRLLRQSGFSPSEPVRIFPGCIAVDVRMPETPTGARKLLAVITQLEGMGVAAPTRPIIDPSERKELLALEEKHNEL